MGEARRPAGSTKGGRGDPEKNLEVTSSRAAALEAPVHVEDSYVIVVETQRVAVGKWAYPAKIDLSAGSR